MDQGRGDAQASGVPTLAELIRRYRDENGSSYEDLASKSNWVISRQGFFKLATQDPLSFPKSAETVRAVAHVLDTDVTTITLAYARSLGLDVQPAATNWTRVLPDAQLVRELNRRLAERAEALAATSGRDEAARATNEAGGVDEVEQARRNRGPAPSSTPAAARSGTSRDITEHTASQQRGEESQDPGGYDPA